MIFRCASLASNETASIIVSPNRGIVAHNRPTILDLLGRPYVKTRAEANDFRACALHLHDLGPAVRAFADDAASCSRWLGPARSEFQQSTAGARSSSRHFRSAAATYRSQRWSPGDGLEGNPRRWQA